MKFREVVMQKSDDGKHLVSSPRRIGYLFTDKSRDSKWSLYAYSHAPWLWHTKDYSMDGRINSGKSVNQTIMSVDD